MKYIITKQNRVTVFPDFISHSTMAKVKNIRSAGYVKVKDNTITTTGKSHSTGIKSRKEDVRLVMRELSRLERRRLHANG